MGLSLIGGWPYELLREGALPPALRYHPTWFSGVFHHLMNSQVASGSLLALVIAVDPASGTWPWLTFLGQRKTPKVMSGDCWGISGMSQVPCSHMATLPV